MNYTMLRGDENMAKVEQCPGFETFGIELNATIPSMPLVVQLFHLCRLPAEKYFNPELRKQETEQYQRVKYKVQLCPEKYLPAIESAIDELMKLDK